MMRFRLSDLPRFARPRALSLPPGCCPDVESCLGSSTLVLEQAGIDTARLDAECLLTAVLGCPRWQLMLEPRRRLSADEFGQLLQLLQRREQREPLAYILGTREFWSLPFSVTSGVLVPRPETETLVETALAAWGEMNAARGEWSAECRVPSRTSPEPRATSPEESAGCRVPGAEEGASVEPPVPSADGDGLSAECRELSADSRTLGPTIVELCTGSGAVAVALAKELPTARILATDVSWRALRVARANAEQHGVAGQITFLRGDLCRAIDGQAPEASVDLMVANPPYIPTGELVALMPEVQWEPRLALDGGADGLRVAREIIETSPSRIRPGGFLLLEIGAEQAEAITECVAASGAWEPVRVRCDLAGRPRVVAARRLSMQNRQLTSANVERTTDNGKPINPTSLAGRRLSVLHF